MNKDEEIGRLTEQLDELLDRLRDNVEALNEILGRAPGCESDERLVPQ